MLFFGGGVLGLCSSVSFGGALLSRSMLFLCGSFSFIILLYIAIYVMLTLCSVIAILYVYIILQKNEYCKCI